VNYRKLGRTDMLVSPVVLGTMATGGAFGKPDDDASIRTMRAMLDAGMNMIDTAQPYGMGHAEEIVGKAIKGRRDQVYIATKCGTMREPGNPIPVRDASKEALRRQVEGSLKRLDIDYIDLYQMHWPVYTTPFEESFTELAKLQKEGKIRYIGVSNFSDVQLEELKQYCDVTTLQPPYSLVDRGIEAAILPYCEKNNIGTLTYGSIGGGVLSGKFPKERPTFDASDTRNENGFYREIFSEGNWPRTVKVVENLRLVAGNLGLPMVQVAIAWVLVRCTVALVGAKTPEQGLMNLKGADIELPLDAIAALNKVF